MKHLKIGWTVLLVATLAVSAQAQSNEMGTRIAEVLLNQPTQTSVDRGVVPQFSFAIDENTKVVKAQFGILMSDTDAVGVTLSGPLSEKGDKSSLTTLDQLDNGVNAELAFAHTKSSRRTADTAKKMHLRADVNRPATLLTPLEQSALCQSFGNRKCSSETDTEDVIHQQSIALNGGAPTPVARFAASVKVAHKKYDFFDSSSTAQNVNRNGWSAGGAAGYFPSFNRPDVLYYASISVKYQSSYKEQDPAEVCTPVSGATANRCKTLPFGAPGNAHNRIAQVDLRQYFGVAFATAPLARYTSGDDAGSNGWSFALPVYVRQSKDAPFNGGVNFTWDRKNKFSVGLFVGVLSDLTKK